MVLTLMGNEHVLYTSVIFIYVNMMWLYVEITFH